MKNIFIQVFCYISVFGGFAWCQDSLQQQFNYAKQLYNEGQYFDAVTELKRLIYFDGHRKYYYEANMLMGEAYKSGAKLNDAISHFTMAEISSKTDSGFYNSVIEIVRANILRRTTQQALRLLDNLQKSGKFNSHADEINYWRGWSYIFADDFKKASDVFSLISSEHELANLSLNTYNDLYSEKAAKILSIFIPGAGQIYTGNYLNGFISLAWNIFAGYLTINSFAEDRIFDGFVTGNLLFLRFYIGNIQNAAEFARERNREIMNKTLIYLQDEYKGLKP